MWKHIVFFYAFAEGVRNGLSITELLTYFGKYELILTKISQLRNFKKMFSFYRYLCLDRNHCILYNILWS